MKGFPDFFQEKYCLWHCLLFFHVILLTTEKESLWQVVAELLHRHGATFLSTSTPSMSLSTNEIFFSILNEIFSKSISSLVPTPACGLVQTSSVHWTHEIRDVGHESNPLISVASGHLTSPHPFNKWWEMVKMGVKSGWFMSQKWSNLLPLNKVVVPLQNCDCSLFLSHVAISLLKLEAFLWRMFVVNINSAEIEFYSHSSFHQVKIQLGISRINLDGKNLVFFWSRMQL